MVAVVETPVDRETPVPMVPVAPLGPALPDSPGIVPEAPPVPAQPEMGPTVPHALERVMLVFVFNAYVKVLRLTQSILPIRRVQEGFPRRLELELAP